MPQMKIPLLTTSRSQFEKSGKHRLGWVETDIDLQTAQAEEFQFCSSTQFGSGISSTHYVYQDAFWTPVADCVLKPINLEGVEKEREFIYLAEDFQTTALKKLSLPSVEKLNNRLKENGHTVPLDAIMNIKVKTKVETRDAQEDDIIDFHKWCETNLRWVDGVLMMPMQEPANVISWTYERSRNIKFRADPILSRHLLQESIAGYFNRGNGINLAPDDFTLKQKFKGIADQLGVSVPTYTPQDQVGDSAWNKVTEAGLDGKLMINGAFVVDPDVYASVTKENRTPMYRRSAVSFISAVANSKARSFDVSNIKEIVSTPLHLQDEVFDQKLEFLLGRDELRDTQTRIAFADATLDQMSERDMGIIPSANPHNQSSLVV